MTADPDPGARLLPARTRRPPRPAPRRPPTLDDVVAELAELRRLVDDATAPVEDAERDPVLAELKALRKAVTAQNTKLDRLLRLAAADPPR